MEIVFHIGAHATGGDRLIRSLLKNRDLLAAQGVAVPEPGRYRKVLADLLGSLRGAEPFPAQRERLLEAIGAPAGTRRVILSNEHFVSAPRRAVAEGRLYPRIAKSAWLRAAVAPDAASFALAIRDPASFVPLIREALGGPAAPPDALDGTDPRALSWADAVAGLRAANPTSPILVWCDEDTPLLWPRILGEVAGIPGSARLAGSDDVLNGLLPPEARRRRRDYLAARPRLGAAARQRIDAAFLARFGQAGLAQDVALPGWTAALIDDLGRRYEADLARIAALPGVRLLLP